MGRYLYQPDPSTIKPPKPSKHVCKLGENDYSSPRSERYTKQLVGTIWLCECGKVWHVKKNTFGLLEALEPYRNMWKRMWIKPNHIVDALMKEEE